MQSNENIIVRTKGNFTSITLNRPSKLNALSRDMIDGLWATYTTLLDQIPAQKLHVALLKGSGGKALCSGGDVKGVVSDAEKGNWKAGVEFFRAENTVDYLISRLADGNMANGKPCIAQVAIMDGIVMGGGAGLAMHGQFRVATEKSVFSMPETAIGFFPDVGASSFLSRAPCGLGALLALSGRRLRGRELLWAGLATHYVPSSHLPALEESLMSAFDGTNVSLSGVSNSSSMHGPGFSSDVDSLHTIDSILASFQEPAAAVAAGVMHWLPLSETIGDIFHPCGTGLEPSIPENLPEDILKEHQHFSALLAVADNYFFRCESVAALLRALEAGTQACEALPSSHGWSLDGPRSVRGAVASRQGGMHMHAGGGMQELERETCRAVLSDLRSMSPMSLRLTFQLYREAAQLSVGQVLERDFKVCANYTRYGWDFWRGVRSKLVEKQKKAQWLHNTVDDVPESLLQLVCCEPDYCNPLDLNVVDRLFETFKGPTGGHSSGSGVNGMQESLLHSQLSGTMLQARL